MIACRRLRRLLGVLHRHIPVGPSRVSPVARPGQSVENMFDESYTHRVGSAFQGSLLDAAAETGLGPLGGSVRRTVLAHGAWVDARPGWITGADALFERLLGAVPWRAERRTMYDRVVDVPRLLCFYGEETALPDPVLAAARDALSEHYRAELGEPLCTAGLCLYRDGRDSVAWHGDTIGRGSTEDTVVAIVSLGTPRALLLRP